MPVKPVRLSYAAADDLRGIQRYTVNQWGSRQWQIYLDKLDGLFQQLGANPALGPERGEVSVGLRSFPMGMGARVIWHRDRDEDLEIVCILHGAMDPNTRL